MNENEIYFSEAPKPGETYFEYMARLSRPFTRRAVELVQAEGPWKALCDPVHKKNLGSHRAVWREIVRDAFASVPGSNPHSMHDMMRRRSSQNVWEHIADASTRSDAAAAWAEAWIENLFHVHGEKTYEVAAGLADRLDQTETRGLTTDVLKLPYPCIYITVPKSAGMHYPMDEAAKLGHGDAYVEGIAVAERWEQHLPIERSIYDPPDPGTPHRLIGWSFVIFGRPERQTADGYRDYYVYTFDMPMPTGVPIDDILKQRMDWIGQMPEDVREIYKQTVGFAPQWERFFRWALNVILYVTNVADKHELEEIWGREFLDAKERLKRLKARHKPEAETLKKQMRQMQEGRRIYLGSHYPRLTEPQKTGKKLEVRTLVQGHYRNQACGAGWKEHKLIWIEPFWRGPTDGVLSNPTRVVTGGLGRHA